MRTRRMGAGCLVVLLAALLLSGCIRVVWHQAPYYKRGPQQAEPADGYLPAGTRVLVFGEKNSYSRVLTFDGIAGHVWKNDLMSLGEWNRQQQQQAEQAPTREFRAEAGPEARKRRESVKPR